MVTCKCKFNSLDYILILIKSLMGFHSTDTLYGQAMFKELYKMCVPNRTHVNVGNKACFRRVQNKYIAYNFNIQNTLYSALF